jgi:hypothetical protein
MSISALLLLYCRFTAALLLLYCIIHTDDLEHQKSVATIDALRNTGLILTLPAKRLYIKAVSRLDEGLSRLY